MTTLGQVIGVESNIKSLAHSVITKVDRQLSKDPAGQQSPLAGITRVFEPWTPEDKPQPAEERLVQVRADEEIKLLVDALTALFDNAATREWGNQQARADIKVDGDVLLSSVPVGYLLFLEKQLTDLVTLTSRLAVLDPAEDWTFSKAAGCYVSKETLTYSTKKVRRAITLVPATDKHPGQAESYPEDVLSGTWRQKKYSGALEASKVARLTERARKLLFAVKYARAECNKMDVEEQEPGATLLSYIFG